MSAPTGNSVAIELAYGTDGTSNTRIWCIGKNTVSTPDETSAPITNPGMISTGTYALLWIDDALILDEYIDPLNLDNKRLHSELRYYKFFTTSKHILFEKTIANHTMNWLSPDLTTIAQIKIQKGNKPKLIFKNFLSYKEIHRPDAKYVPGTL